MPIDASVLRLCLVTDRGLARGRPLMQIVDAAVRGGVTMVQLREKAATTRAFLEEARALKSLLAPLGVPLIINDRLDIAMAVDADGVHVGQTDLPVEVARRILGPSKIVGLSISDSPQILRPETACADYLGIGPIYPQQTKEDADPTLGVEGFRRLRELTQKPMLVIGGLNPDNSAPLLVAGADGVAVVSAIVSADEPGEAAKRFIRLYG
jgi:thiamine-phosphate pyrophosphorylase